MRRARNQQTQLNQDSLIEQEISNSPGICRTHLQVGNVSPFTIHKKKRATASDATTETHF